jgi:hypothetical protein
MAASKWVRPEVSSLRPDPSPTVHSYPSLALLMSSLSTSLASAQVYPLFAATGVAVGICFFSLFRNITGNPEVRYGSGF